MNVLALDGALGAFSAAVAADARIAAAECLGPNRALEEGLTAVSRALRSAGVAPDRLDRVAVGTGPGGFTGLRIALAYAKSLAQAWQLPLVGISSFDLLEYGRDLPAALAVVVGRTGVISGRLRCGDQVRRASGPTARTLAELLDGCGSCNELAVLGAPKDVLDALAERGITVIALEPTVRPAAAAAALLASSREPARSAHAVRADYGELPAATLRAAP